MRTDLDHLPDAKRRELHRVLRILFEGFEETTAIATSDWKKRGRILKVILYGSYARGGWVDEPHTAKGYQSDFDLLVIVNHPKLTDRVAIWSAADERLMRERIVTETLRTPVSFIVHTLDEVNDGLAQGRYFFMDIKRDGIALYDADGIALHEPKPKTSGEALAMAREYFEEWRAQASSAIKGYRFFLKQREFRDAAFILHQAVERLYHGVLLTLTFYTPHIHNLAFLRAQAERLDARLQSVWPSETRVDRARFEKLKDAYVKARYAKSFAVTEEELAWLGERVEALAAAVESVCRDRIAELESKAAA